MIYASYRLDKDTFRIALSNTPDVWPAWKPITATFHIENAIKKAISGGKVKDFEITIVDEANTYLHVIAYTLVTYLRGLGFETKILV